MRTKEEYNEYMRKYNKCYRQNNPDKANKWDHSRYEEIKIKAMNVLGGLKCIICGCTNLKLVEVNLKGGGHGKLVRDGKMKIGKLLYWDIVKGRVDANLFDVRCKVCNIAHYVKLKYNVDYTINCITR